MARALSGRIGLIAIAIALILCLFTAGSPNLLDGLNHFDSVLLLLIGIGLLRSYLIDKNLNQVVAGTLAQGWISGYVSRLFGLYTGLALFLSLALAPIIGSLARTSGLDAKRHAVIAMRAICASMFLLPTTVGAGAVNASLHDFPLLKAVVFGSPIAVLSMWLSVIEGESNAVQGQLADRPSPTPADRFALSSATAAFIVLAITIKVGLNATTVSAIALAMTTTGCAGICLSHSVNDLSKRIEALISKTMPQITLFLASGLLMAAVSGFVPAARSALSDGMLDVLGASAVQIFLITVVLPALSVIGLHPMLLWAIFFPPLHEVTHMPDLVEYLCWIFMFVSAQLISPVSISVILTSASVERSSWEMSWGSHGRHIVMLTVPTATYLYLLDLVSI
ncbi:hypothetical protein C84B14_14149 [Salinisphaera sp. C84B14]|uniref:hypothetical protein n=1 Tax=Salinisphaera sp. C84B14 TaxID=1304155 RepID=UPI003340C191